MGITTNGTTQEITGRFDKSDGDDKRNRLGSFPPSSRSYGIESFRAFTDDCSRESGIEQSSKSQPHAGKILERLELLEGAYLSVVDEDSSYLENRLTRYKREKEVFLRETQALKQEILNLLASEESSDN